MAKLIGFEVGMREYTDIELEYLEQNWEAIDFPEDI